VQSVHRRHDVKPSATSTPNPVRRHLGCVRLTRVRSVVPSTGPAERRLLDLFRAGLRGGGSGPIPRPVDARVVFQRRKSVRRCTAGRARRRRRRGVALTPVRQSETRKQQSSPASDRHAGCPRCQRVLQFADAGGVVKNTRWAYAMPIYARAVRRLRERGRPC
jgi:hypothetical protein